jgi:hypothetical protein
MNKEKETLNLAVAMLLNYKESDLKKVTNFSTLPLETLITTKLLDFVHRPDFHKPENTTFRKLDLFPKRCVFWFVEIQMMDKVQKLSSNECYTPSSEPFRMYLWKYL